MVIVQQANPVVIALEVEELVLDRVLESRVKLITTARQVNIVVMQTNVLFRVLVNRVNIIPTAHQVNIVVVLIEHVP